MSVAEPPVKFSLATVFLFAGPHKWFEARYALGRLPARAGKLWGFFAASALGVVGLAVAYAAVPVAAPLIPDASPAAGLYAIWNTAFLLWVAALVWMRLRTNPRFDGVWAWSLACLLRGVVQPAGAAGGAVAARPRAGPLAPALAEGVPVRGRVAVRPLARADAVGVLRPRLRHDAARLL